MGPGRSSILRIGSNPTEASSSGQTGGNDCLAVVVHRAAPREPPSPLDKGKGKINEIRYPSSSEYLRVAIRAGNEPSYSGSARKKLGSGLARELNEPSLSLNLGLINLGLCSGSGSGSAQKSSAQAAGTHLSLERGFRLRSPTDRIWYSPVRS